MSEEELIETLRAFKKNKVEQLEEPARNLFYAIMKIANERDRLNNIINELEKYIGNEYYCFDNESLEFKIAKDILNKLQELKGSNLAIPPEVIGTNGVDGGLFDYGDR